MLKHFVGLLWSGARCIQKLVRLHLNVGNIRNASPLHSNESIRQRCTSEIIFQRLCSMKKEQNFSALLAISLYLPLRPSPVHDNYSMVRTESSCTLRERSRRTRRAVACYATGLGVRKWLDDRRCGMLRCGTWWQCICLSYSCSCARQRRIEM